MEAYLTADAHIVETAAGAQEAMGKFKAGRFDLVVTDRAMPGMSGGQLAAMIKEVVPNVPIILLTGFGEMMLAKDESITGVDVIVGKPLTLVAMREALTQAMGKDSTPV